MGRRIISMRTRLFCENLTCKCALSLEKGGEQSDKIDDSTAKFTLNCKIVKA